jgi:hypothetical protein
MPVRQGPEWDHVTVDNKKKNASTAAKNFSGIVRASATILVVFLGMESVLALQLHQNLDF